MLARGAPAADAPAADEAAELAALLDTLEEVTEIATRNRMNTDYVPGMVTVLRGEELESRGIATVWQALGLVSGVEITRNNFGEPLVLMRGVGQTLHSGNLKVMLNSVPMNNDLNGYAPGVMQLPVAMVERIEVYRGPGSALYGEYAYAGVVNVVTRQEGQGVYLRFDSHDSAGGGGYASWRSPSGKLKLFGDLSRWSGDGSRIDSGPDAFTTTGYSYAPGPIDDREGDGVAILGAEFNGFRLLSQYTRMEHGPWFGRSALPPPDPLAIGVTRHHTLSLDKGWALADDLDLQTRLYHQAFSDDSPEVVLVPPGYPTRIPPSLPAPPPGAPVPLAPPEGVVNQRSSDLRRSGAEASLTWDGWTDHQWLFGLGYARSEVTGSSYAENGATILPYNARTAGLPEGADRKLVSATVQDQWRIGERLELTGGIHYDDYSDVGDSITPRLAAVWRHDDRHLFKGQYAEAFRPPTFGELFDGTRNGRRLRPETLRSLELSYIYRVSDTRFQLTVFNTELQDLISEVAGPDRYRNLGEIRQRGAEAEWERRFAANWRLGANLSFLDSVDRPTGKPVGGSARWLANVTLDGRLAPEWQLSARLNHVGDRAGWPGGGTAPLDDYTTVSLGLSRFDLGAKGGTLRFGVENLFDDEVQALATVDTYRGNLTQPGRSGWLQYSYAIP
ncbi:hypothetical protein JCM17961_28660 [Endothiovibrio diazotrophicus]